LHTEELDEEIGKKLKLLRKEKKWSQREVAEKIDVNFTYISKIENGRIPSLTILKKLADLYGVSVPSLFGEEQDVPEELKEVGVEWISFGKEMKQANLSPEDVKRYVEVVKSLKNL
jgi:transcriptional regulator with XRE-family HTH domain